MSNASKEKGKTWERDVANFLSKTYGETFMRVPNSGAFIGGQNTKRKEVLHEGQIRIFKGDIIPGPSFSKMNVECKFYKEFPFHQLVSGTPIRLLDSWIEQLLEPADENDFNILLMKFNNKGKYVVTHKKNHPPLSSFGVEYCYQKDMSIWKISEFDNFWMFNESVVRQLCS